MEKIKKNKALFIILGSVLLLVIILVVLIMVLGMSSNSIVGEWVNKDESSVRLVVDSNTMTMIEDDERDSIDYIIKEEKSLGSSELALNAKAVIVEAEIEGEDVYLLMATFTNKYGKVNAVIDNCNLESCREVDLELLDEVISEQSEFVYEKQ